MSTCGTCKLVLSSVSGESIVCVGPCKSQICRSCSGLTKAAVKVVSDCLNVHFYCEKCNPYSIKEVSDELKEIKSSIDKLNEAVASVCKPSSNSLISPMIASNHLEPSPMSSLKRRRVDNTWPTERTTPLPPRQDVIIGSCQTAALQTVEGRKCVVASMLHPTTKPEDLAAYLKKALVLNADDTSIRCSLLIPAGRDIGNLDFVSFKIGIPESKYSLLLAPNIWPNGVKVRPFVPKIGNRTLGKFLPIVPPVVSSKADL